MVVDFEQKIRRLKFEYMNYCPRREGWWLREPIRPILQDQLLPIIAGHGDQLLEATKIISLSSKKGRAIVDHFSPLGIAVIDDNGMRFLAKRGQKPKLNVCFIPQSHRETQPASCWYNGDTVNIFAVEWAQPTLAAFVGHELGHAYCHRAKQSLATAQPTDSDIRIDEEIWAHTFESQILNYQSKQRFHKTIDRMLDRKAKSWQEATASLKVNDLKELDKTLGVSSCNIQTASLLLDEYLLVSGFRFIDRLQLEKEQKQRQKRAVYRQLP